MAIESAHIKGIVKEIGADGRVKVLLPEYDGLVTDWLPVAQSLTLGARTWAVPRLDTQVIVLPGLGLEDAVVLGAIYSQPDPPPFGDAAVIGMTADDGVSISYDPGASTLTIESPKLIKITATNIEIEADIKITGDRDITGETTISGGTTQKGDVTVTGAMDWTGDVTITGDVTHTGNTMQTGSLTTGAVTAGGLSIAPGAGGGGSGGAEIAGDLSVTGPVTAPAITADAATIGGKDFATHVHPTTSPGAPTGVPV